MVQKQQNNLTELKRMRHETALRVPEVDLEAGSVTPIIGTSGGEEEGNTEEYNPIVDNPFLRPFDAPL